MTQQRRKHGFIPESKPAEPTAAHLRCDLQAPAGHIYGRDSIGWRRVPSLPAGYAIYKLIEKEPAGPAGIERPPGAAGTSAKQLRDSRSQLLRAAYYEVMRNQTHVENHLAETDFQGRRSVGCWQCIGFAVE